MTNTSDLYKDCFFISLPLLTIDAKRWEKITLRNDSERVKRTLQSDTRSLKSLLPPEKSARAV